VGLWYLGSIQKVRFVNEGVDLKIEKKMKRGSWVLFVCLFGKNDELNSKTKEIRFSCCEHFYFPKIVQRKWEFGQILNIP